VATPMSWFLPFGLGFAKAAFFFPFFFFSEHEGPRRRYNGQSQHHALTFTPFSLKTCFNTVLYLRLYLSSGYVFL